GGCLALLSEQPERIDRSQIVGVWTGSGGARVDLRADGRFEMSGIPRSAIRFSFVDPPPGNGRLSGSGTWEPEQLGSVETDTVEAIDLAIDAGGSFSDRSQMAELRVARSGWDPVLYFAVNVDKWYGFEVSKSG
ncbi:hypothetical protein ROS62_30575, partial [Streptomyces sp. DSM 41972]|nr:hypothetical protein [Streptomyces sp. DSM 41972]